jgi:hypothetical protein
MNRRFWTTWPFLCLLAYLFLLAIVAPRTWWHRGGGKRADGDFRASSSRWTSTLPDNSAHATASSDTTELTRISDAALLTEDSAARPSDGEALGEVPEPQDSSSPSALTSAPAEPDMAQVSPAASQPSLPREPLPEPALTIASEPAPIVEPKAEPKAEPTIKHLPTLSDVAAVPSELPPEEEAPETVWPKPQSLLDRVDELAWDCETGLWAREVNAQIRKLGLAVAARSDEALPIIGRLNELTREADGLAQSLERNGNPLASTLRRTQHALGRRLDIWRRVMLSGGPGCGSRPKLDQQRLSTAVNQIDAILGNAEAGMPWREYLQLAALEQLAQQSAAEEQDDARQVARTVLKRLTRTQVSAEQRRFLAKPPMISLTATLREWLEGTVDLVGVLRHVEWVERDGLSSDGRLLAEDCKSLAGSPVPEHRGLGNRLMLHYRNANVRVAVTEDILNRLIPEREPQFQYVNDEVNGRPVQGQSVTSTNVGVKLIPDPGRLRLALEIKGLVSALTSSQAGPATFYNDSESTYTARKELELTTQGISLAPADVEVYNDLQLQAVKTDLDPIPLIGSLVKGVARNQHEQSRPSMSREVERKVATRAKLQIDSEADARLGRASQRLRSRFIEPFAAMSLGPTMISAQTTESRMTMRLRFGSDDQLGAWTPRPQAPADSLLSIQMHESVLNNLFEQLELDGGTFTVAELRQRVAERFNRPEMLKAESPNDDVVIRFAPKNAARIQCRDGRLMVTLSIASLSRSPHRWKNFQVRAFYRPQLNGHTAELVRDGVVRLTGERLNTGAQIALRGIFSKTFSKDGSWQLTPQVVLDNPRMKQMGITQVVVEDGWIGLAFGPARRLASDPVVARRSEAETETE